MKEKTMKKRWLILFSLVTLISLLGVGLTGQAGNFTLPDNLSAQDYANIAWMITATIFVLMMTPGLAFFYGGMVRAKNVISTMLQSFIVMGVVSVIWVVFGFGLSFGNDIGGLIGNPADFFMLNHVGCENMGAPGTSPLSQIDLGVTTIPLALFALFQMKFAIITPSLITGSFAERVKFSGYLIFMMLWVIFVYCPLAHWTWHPEGIFAQMHVHDFAGGIVGTVLTGVFTYSYFYPQAEGAEVSHLEFFLNHMLAVVIVFSYTFIMSYALYWLTNKMVRMRVSAKSERIGLDKSQHDEEYGTEVHTEIAEEVPSESEWMRSVAEN